VSIVSGTPEITPVAELKERLNTEGLGEICQEVTLVPEFAG
tara:strand:+ start:474 stop:596 length:123 start_codon:yes stop_codon:yes gene_type:complete